MKSNKRVGGILFIAAAIAFFAAAAAADQPAFYGVGAALIAVGAVFLAQARKQG